MAQMHQHNGLKFITDVSHTHEELTVNYQVLFNLKIILMSMTITQESCRIANSSHKHFAKTYIYSLIFLKIGLLTRGKPHLVLKIFGSHSWYKARVKRNCQ